jgi:hypothetical protein
MGEDLFRMLFKISCALSLGHARSGLVGQRVEEAPDDPNPGCRARGPGLAPANPQGSQIA